VAKADRRFSYRQLILIQRFLKPTWGWVIGDAIDRGELEPMKGWNKVTWVTPRRITVDAGREAQQNRADVETGLKTLEDHYAELGMDFQEELEKRGQNAKEILEIAKRYGVPPEMLYKPQGSKLAYPVTTEDG
jgi:capsid protein